VGVFCEVVEGLYEKSKFSSFFLGLLFACSRPAEPSLSETSPATSASASTPAEAVTTAEPYRSAMDNPRVFTYTDTEGLPLQEVALRLTTLFIEDMTTESNEPSASPGTGIFLLICSPPQKWATRRKQSITLWKRKFRKLSGLPKFLFPSNLTACTAPSGLHMNNGSIFYTKAAVLVFYCKKTETPTLGSQGLLHNRKSAELLCRNAVFHGMQALFFRLKSLGFLCLERNLRSKIRKKCLNPLELNSIRKVMQENLHDFFIVKSPL
jgi:hypothetical protein